MFYKYPIKLVSWNQVNKGYEYGKSVIWVLIALTSDNINPTKGPYK